MNSVDNIDRDYAEAWRPDPGDKLIGTVVETSERTGEYGKYPIVTVRQGETAETELAFHAIHTVAQVELADMAPQVGETIAIKYLGKREAANGKATYHAYKIAVDRAAEKFDWSDYASGQVDIPETDAPAPSVAPQQENGGDDDIPF
jgi:hypothetical protein